MTKGLASLPAVLISAAAFGQGQVDFNNRVAPDVNAPVYLCDGTGPGGVGGYKAQLLLVNGTSTTPITPVTTFRSSPAAAQFYVVDPGVGVDIPGTKPGDVVILRMIAFNGSSFANSTDRGNSSDFQVTLGGGTLPPASLAGLAPFRLGTLEETVCPEPPVIALAVLSLGLLVVRRRASVQARSD